MATFIQYFSDPDKEVAVYHGRCHRRSPNALKVNFTLNGIKDMKVLKHD